jgi:hypothetical protein
MCCFSRPIAEVSGTSIFARLDGDRQALAYQMHLASPEDVAMILPLPIALGHGEKAVEFVDLSEAPRLFEELRLCFWRPTRAAGAALATAAAGTAGSSFHYASNRATVLPHSARSSRRPPGRGRVRSHPVPSDPSSCPPGVGEGVAIRRHRHEPRQHPPSGSDARPDRSRLVSLPAPHQWHAAKSRHVGAHVASG